MFNFSGSSNQVKHINPLIWILFLLLSMGLGACDDPPKEKQLSLPSLPDLSTQNACQDGKDNDDDGLIDFPDDPGCLSEQDISEYNPPALNDLGLTEPIQTACNNDEDDDDDGYIDYPDDPGCSSLDDQDETDPLPPQCRDGRDNDGDGLSEAIRRRRKRVRAHDKLLDDLLF